MVMTEKNPSIDPATAARIGEELDQAVANLSASESNTDKIDQTPIAPVEDDTSDEPTTIHSFQDPMAEIGLRDEEPLMATKTEAPKEEVSQTAKVEADQETKDLLAEIERINTAVREGNQAAIFGFNANEKAEARVVELEDKIRQQEKIQKSSPVEDSVKAEEVPANQDIQAKKKRIDEINSAVRDGKVAGLYGFSSDAMDQANEEVERLEKEIRESENPQTPPLEKTETLSPAETERKEMREQIARLEEQVRQLSEKLDGRPTAPVEPVTETVLEDNVDISEPEPAPQIDPHVLEEEEVLSPTTPEAQGEMAPASFYSEALKAFHKESEDELAQLKASKENGQETSTGKSLWERAKEGGVRKVSWLKERAKGLATMGYWEVRQAEKVRKAGSDVEESLRSRSWIFKEENLNESDRQLIKDRLRESGNDVENMSDENLLAAYEWLGDHIVGQKVEWNQIFEDGLIKDSIKKIEEKLQGKMGAGYRTFGGEAVLEGNRTLTEEKRKEIETKLREALGALRKSQIDKDLTNYGKLVRGSIDPNWYKRYVAGGIEAALLATGVVTWMTFGSAIKTKLLGGAAKEGLKQVVSDHSGAVLDIPKDIGIPADMADQLPVPDVGSMTAPLKDNLWNMGRDLLQRQGIASPTDGQIMEVTKQLALDNQVSVSKWGLNAGKWIDSAMPKGLPIKIGGALKVASLAVRGIRMATGV